MKLFSFQLTAESVLYEVTPDNPALNNRNRRPIAHQAQAPQDVRHGMQLAYDLIADVSTFFMNVIYFKPFPKFGNIPDVRWK